jgi:hypothetical protein
LLQRANMADERYPRTIAWLEADSELWSSRNATSIPVRSIRRRS